MNPSTDASVVEALSNLVANDRQNEKLDELFNDAQNLAAKILNRIPPCADRSTAIRKLREAMHVVRDAIVLRALV